MTGSKAVRVFSLASAVTISLLASSCGSSGGSFTNPLSLKSIAVTPSNPTIVAGTAQTFTANATYSDGSQRDVTMQASWASGTTSVATLAGAADPQSVNGVSAGSSIITATVGAISGTTLLTVTAPPPTLTGIVVTPLNPTIVAGNSQSFAATGSYSDNSHKDVTAQATWQSGTTSVATIGGAADPQPVNGIAPGTSTISATIGQISGLSVLTVIPSGSISVAVSPRNAALVAKTQTQQFDATVTGDPNNLGVTWDVDSIPGGDASVGTISVSGVYTPPSAAGTHTITATSVADTSRSATAAVAVTDLTGVLTYHDDQARDGVNSHEFALTAANVSQNTFGKRFACQVDGAIYAEPLWEPGLQVSGASHNVVFVATQHDGLYAFDADATPCQQLWHADLIDGAHGGTANETTVCWDDVGSGNGDIQPEVGVTGTPVIDPETDTLYVVSKSENGGCSTGITPTYYQRLHAIDVFTGNEKMNGPVTITASVSGSGFGSSGGAVPFNAKTEGQRPGLALLKSVVTSGSLFDVVYISWASHEDASPYHGWLIGYNAANVSQQLEVFNSTPNGGLGGIWMSGDAPAVDSSNNVYLATGNGTFDVNTGGKDLGDSVVRLATSGSLGLTDYFTPFNQANLASNDVDLGAGGVVLLPDQTTGLPHLLLAGGKQGLMYLVDRDNMGEFTVGTDNVVQEIQADNGSWTTPAFWQNNMYIAGSGDSGSCDLLKAYPFSAATDSFAAAPTSSTSYCFPFPGATPSISSSGTSNGIVWAMDVHCYTTAQSPCSGPALLFAYDATNLGTELWNSSQATGNRDQAGAAVKFATPTVANGKVYIGTRTELDVYGLLP